MYFNVNLLVQEHPKCTKKLNSMMLTYNILVTPPNNFFNTVPLHPLWAQLTWFADTSMGFFWMIQVTDSVSGGVVREPG